MTDLYSILVSYANKNNSPYIDINPFLAFLEQYAKTLCTAFSGENPEWLRWARDPSAHFWAEITALTENGKCQVLTDTPDGRVYMPHFNLQRLQDTYQKADDDTDVPFHNEESLKIILPESQIKPLTCSDGLLSYLEQPQDSDLPILRIVFPEEFGSALVLASMIPRRLAEIALLKIRRYLRTGGNTEYVQSKLKIQLPYRVTNLKDQISRILIRPFDCYREMEEGGEFSCLFWGYFCVVMKNDIKKKKEYFQDDIAVMQSTLIIEAFNGYYKAQAAKRRGRELAFKSLEAHLAKPPFLFTLDEICKFTSDKGVLLLSLYTNNELETWLKKETTQSESGALPPVLIVHDEHGNRFYTLKTKTPLLCLKLLSAARKPVRDAIISHWRKLLLDFASEDAMENSAAFEKLLFAFIKKENRVLANLLEDPKLALVFAEVEESESAIPSAAKIFSQGRLLPYSSLLFIERKELLYDLKLMLPFWYSLPVLTAIIAFFRHLGGKKKTSTKNNILGEKSAAGEIADEASELETLLVPAGYTAKSYLEELETRWSQRLDKEARKNLIADVKTLIRDNLRQKLRLEKKLTLDRENVNQIAQDIIKRTPSLAALHSEGSLIQYAELYIVRLLKTPAKRSAAKTR